MPVTGFDHVAIPTERPEELIAFYGALGFSVPDVTEWRRSGVPFFAVQLGDQKINVHGPELWRREDFALRGPSAVPGCGDLCFVWQGGMDSLGATLERAGAAVVAGPVDLQGGRGQGRSLYTRDPDSNLLEFIVYDADASPELVSRLEAVEQSLDAGRYAPGPWGEFLEVARSAPAAELRKLAPDVTRVSDKLHGRRKVRKIEFERGVAFEVLGACAGLSLLAWGASVGSPVPLVLAAIVLAATLQPLLKVAVGLALGMRYSYAYLWHVEPRFKLQFGSYLASPVWKRVAVHLSGTLGSPLGCLAVASAAHAASPTLGRVLIWIVVAHLAFQAALLLLAVLDIRRVPVYGLLRLTSAGAAGFELRRARREQGS